MVVNNSPYLQQMFCNQKQKHNVPYEIHFKELNNSTIHPIISWVDIFFGLENNYNIPKNIMSFVVKNWNGKIYEKQEVIIETIKKISMQLATKNIVVIMDFDTEHKKGNMENSIIKATKILRCYQFDSRTTELLQLSDLLLGAYIRGKNMSLNEENFEKIFTKITEGKNAKKSELKDMIATYLYKKIKKFPDKIKELG